LKKIYNLVVRFTSYIKIMSTIEVNRPATWVEGPWLNPDKSKQAADKLNQSTDPKVFALALNSQIREWDSIVPWKWKIIECPWNPVEFKVSDDWKSLNIKIWDKSFSWKMPWWAVVQNIKRTWDELIISTDRWSSNVPISWLSNTLADLSSKWSATVWSWMKKVNFALAWK